MAFPNDSPIDISEAGRHARERGDPRNANPYPEGSQEHAIWDRGYGMPDGESEPQADDKPPRG